MRLWLKRACAIRNNRLLLSRGNDTRTPFQERLGHPLFPSVVRLRERAQTVMAASTTTVSAVVEAARVLFEKRIPSAELTPKDIQGILAALGRVTVAQVGLEEKKEEEERKKSPSGLLNMPFLEKKSSARAPITYYHIYECPDFTVGIFCIPKDGDIPIHDHPDMTVCSKVLFGKVRVEAYDEAPDLQEQLQLENALVARKVRDDVVSEETGPFALFTKSNNIHRFSAVESCAIIDVLGPPYDSSEGREIAYYRETMKLKNVVDNNGAHDNVVVLEVVNPPSDYVVEGREYTGERAI
mmetsp:Transcript_3157/g.9347  ORF Transcript_3157/g.9347 Transcript_3157/m.9347 type:complete len:297 (+) Transcript_3157:97-987(+)